ncbi:MAG: competence/damage-inducible protein A [Candidatus Omnitrophica bacterium]|nr:competence/damage-inducible protein A [Candidatus Omnitrophota bacterium]
MNAELLTVGSELTSGATINTNTAHLARRLAEIGIACRRQTSVSDEPTLVRGALEEALQRSNLVILTGGLGPTFDDVTMEAIAQATRRPLVLMPGAAATIRRFYLRRHRRLQRAAMRQAYVPRGGQALPNPIGTAPGLWLSLEQQVVVALPGVPSEMRAILEASVMPRLKRWLSDGAIESRTVRTVGLVELQIQRALQRLRIPPAVELGLYPALRMVDVRLTVRAPSRAQARARLAPVEAAVRRALGRAVYGTDDETLERVVGGLLLRRRATIAVAESCTGGMVCDRLTNVPGSSRYMRGGVVAYHNDLKRGLLMVPAALLTRYGAVSAPVARAMAHGVRRATGADVGVSITGIAGPSGATAGKPVGLVYFGLADRRGSRTLRSQFFGDRLSIKTQAAQTALNWLRLYLLNVTR